MRLARRQADRVRRASWSGGSAPQIGDDLVAGDPRTPIRRPRRASTQQRERVAQLEADDWPASDGAEARRPARRWPTRWCKKSVWIVGGDGWAYDIGFGGLDHVLASGAQRQHPGARHRGLLEHRRPGVEGDAARRGGEVRRRRQAGRPRRTSALMAMSYGNVYVAQVAMGANDAQTVKAFLEAEAYRRAVADHRLQPLHRPRHRHGARRWTSRRRRCKSGYWPLFRYNPTLAEQGKNPFQLDSRAPNAAAEGVHLQRNALHDARQEQSRGSRSELLELAQQDVDAALAALRAHGRRRAPTAR